MLTSDDEREPIQSLSDAASLFRWLESRLPPLKAEGGPVLQLAELL
jgi:hypothetical protein